MECGYWRLYRHNNIAMKIVLVRHGRPANSQNIRLNSAGFANWVKNYNHSLVASDSRPAFSFNDMFANYYIVSSDLPRAIHSCKIAFNRPPAVTSALFREMDIPRFKLPFTLNAWTWVYLNRVLWTIGKSGPFESYTKAKSRAESAAVTLIDIAKKESNVIVFAHGYLNLHMRKHFRAYGLKQTSKSSAYWGVTMFES